MFGTGNTIKPRRVKLFGGQTESIALGARMFEGPRVIPIQKN